MLKNKVSEEEVALRRINIFKNRRFQFVFVRKWLKKAYIIEKEDFRFVSYYQNRLFLVLLTFILMTIYLNSVWPWPIIIALVVWILSEAGFYFLLIKRMTPTKLPENDLSIGFIASALNEEYKIVNIKIGSYIAVGIVGGIAIFYGSYEGIYLLGMIGISAFGFIQAGFYLYIQSLRKKGPKKV